MFHKIATLLFPPKCILCRRILEENETDLCHGCRAAAPEFGNAKSNLSFLAEWTAVWYYKDDARKSLLRYKFSGRRSYALAYGKLLAMKLEQEGFLDFDVLTWVPIGPLRRFGRGYDQDELLAKALGTELSRPAVQTLRKIRNTPPQSGLKDVSRRRANVLGAYRAVDPEIIREKRVLLIDDIITTGATVSECARVLLTAGAKEVTCAAMAAASHDTK